MMKMESGVPKKMAGPELQTARAGPEVAPRGGPTETTAEIDARAAADLCWWLHRMLRRMADERGEMSAEFMRAARRYG